MEIKINIDEKELSARIENLVSTKSRSLIRTMVKDMVHAEIAKVIEEYNIWDNADDIHKATNEFVLEELRRHLRNHVYGDRWRLSEAEREMQDNFFRGCATAYAYLYEEDAGLDTTVIREEVLKDVSHSICTRIGRKIQIDKATREDLAERIAALIAEKSDKS